MNEFNHNFKKKFGQNFITDSNIIDKIVSTVIVDKNDLIIEIGPGTGVLTRELVKKCNVLAYEVDIELKKALSELEGENLTIIWDDFLKRKVSDDIKNIPHKNLYLVANLPYYITTPIIEKLIEEALDIKNIVIMVQKEVADRFSAKPGSKQYGSITVFLNYYFQISKVLDVPKEKFYPQPKVDSAVISLKQNINRPLIKNEETLFKLIKDSFKYKRKTLKNNLRNYNLAEIENVLKKYGKNLNDRAETISLELFSEISKQIDKKNTD